MYRQVKQEPNDALEHLAQSVRRKRKADEAPAVVKKEIKTEPEEVDIPGIQSNIIPAPIPDVKYEVIPGPCYDDLEEFIRVTDEAETKPLSREGIRKILKMEDGMDVKKEVGDYEEYATTNQATVSDASNYAAETLPKIEEDHDLIDAVLKEEPVDYEEKPNTDLLDAPSTSTATPAAPVESPPDFSEDRKEKPFKCGQCGAAFKFRYLLNLHYKSNHVVGKAINTRPYSALTRAPVIVWDAKKPSRDAREETTWRGHTMAEGCHFTAAGNKLLRDESECKALYMDCDECGERFGSVKAHRMHALQEHPDSPAERLCKNKECVLIREINRQKGIVPEERRRTASEIVLVLKSMHEPVKCPICTDSEFEFRSYFHLHKHYVSHHVKEFNMKYLCKACDILFDAPTKLRNHIIQKTMNNKRSKCIGATGILRWPKAKK